MAGPQYMGRDAKGATALKETTLEKLYNTYAKQFRIELRDKFGGLFPSKPLSEYSEAEIANISGELMESKEYWKALDDAYKGFEESMKALSSQGKLQLDGMKLPANEAIAKAELLLRTEYAMAAEGLNSLGLEGAWKKLGKELKANMKAKKGRRQMGVARQSDYEKLLEDPDRFAQSFKESKNLLEFLNKVTQNEGMARKIYQKLSKGSPTDFKLLEAAVKLKIVPDVAELPKVTIRGKLADKLFEAGRMNLASMWGGVKGMAKLIKMVREQATMAARAAALGSRTIRQEAYREFAQSEWLHKATTTKLVIGFIALWALKSCVGSKVEKSLGLDSTPKKDPMSDALRGVAASNLNRKNITKMLDALEVEGRKLSEEEKMRALRIAGGSKQDTSDKTLTEYVKIAAILQFMPNKKANEIAKLSKAVYAYVDPKKQEEFARKALEFSKKEPKLDAGALFAKTMASSEALKGAVLESYWGREFSPRLFVGFAEGGKANPNLSPLRSMLRKAAVDKKITQQQMVNLAKMFASLYTATNKKGEQEGYVPKTYESDFEAALNLTSRGFTPMAIRASLSGMSGYFDYYQQGKAQQAISEVMERLPKAASGAQVRGMLLDYMQEHKGWLKKGSLARYTSFAIGKLLDENSSLEKLLDSDKRKGLANYLSRRYLGTKGAELLTYEQIVNVAAALGKYASANDENLMGVRNSKTSVFGANKFMDEFVDTIYPPEPKPEAAQDAGPES
ncbi:hypothetical protein JW721_04520 [Candidatus Micrarchaeota archaeon]|nr:hypothetical protein [Candidatus Micrarchaeota archaeon]